MIFCCCIFVLFWTKLFIIVILSSDLTSGLTLLLKLAWRLGLTLWLER